VHTKVIYIPESQFSSGQIPNDCMDPYSNFVRQRRSAAEQGFVANGKAIDSPPARFFTFHSEPCISPELDAASVGTTSMFPCLARCLSAMRFTGRSASFTYSTLTMNRSLSQWHDAGPFLRPAFQTLQCTEYYNFRLSNLRGVEAFRLVSFEVPNQLPCTESAAKSTGENLASRRSLGIPMFRSPCSQKNSDRNHPETFWPECAWHS
jgi:hypothetical protein